MHRQLALLTLVPSPEEAEWAEAEWVEITYVHGDIHKYIIFTAAY